MIIGVILRGFDGVEPVTRTSDSDSDHDEGRPATFGFRRLKNDRFRWVEVFSRLKPDVTMEKTRAGLQPLFHQILNREVTEQPFSKASPFVKQEFLKMWMQVMPGSKGRSNLRWTYS